MDMSDWRSSFETAAWLMPSALASVTCVSFSWRRSLARMAWARTSAWRRAAGGSCLRSSAKGLAIIVLLWPLFRLLEALQMAIEGRVGHRHMLVVPFLVARLVAAQQQNGGAPRIEREEDAQRPTAMLDAEFLHVLMFRPFDLVDIGPAQGGAALFQDAQDRND